MTDQPTQPSFEEFNRRLSAMPDYEASSARSLYLARLGFAISLLAFALSTLVTQLPLSAPVLLVILAVLIATEIAGVALHVWNSREDYSSMRRPLHTHALRLDHDLPYHTKMIDWLVAWPEATLLKYADMARFRRERMEQRMPILLGNVDKLGILPVVVAIYFQFREYQAGRHIGLIEGAFVFVAALMYALTWSTAMTKSRLDQMDMYLREAVDVQTKRAATDAVPESPGVIPN